MSKFKLLHASWIPISIFIFVTHPIQQAFAQTSTPVATAAPSSSEVLNDQVATKVDESYCLKITDEDKRLNCMQSYCASVAEKNKEGGSTQAAVTPNGDTSNSSGDTGNFDPEATQCNLRACNSLTTNSKRRDCQDNYAAMMSAGVSNSKEAVILTRVAQALGIAAFILGLLMTVLSNFLASKDDCSAASSLLLMASGLLSAAGTIAGFIQNLVDTKKLIDNYNRGNFLFDIVKPKSDDGTTKVGVDSSGQVQPDQSSDAQQEAFKYLIDQNKIQLTNLRIQVAFMWASVALQWAAVIAGIAENVALVTGTGAQYICLTHDKVKDVLGKVPNLGKTLQDKFKMGNDNNSATESESEVKQNTTAETENKPPVEEPASNSTNDNSKALVVKSDESQVTTASSSANEGTGATQHNKAEVINAFDSNGLTSEGSSDGKSTNVYREVTDPGGASRPEFAGEYKLSSDGQLEYKLKGQTEFQTYTGPAGEENYQKIFSSSSETSTSAATTNDKALVVANDTSENSKALVVTDKTVEVDTVNGNNQEQPAPATQEEPKAGPKVEAKNSMRENSELLDKISVDEGKNRGTIEGKNGDFVIREADDGKRFAVATDKDGNVLKFVEESPGKVVVYDDKTGAKVQTIEGKSLVSIGNTQTGANEGSIISFSPKSIFTGGSDFTLNAYSSINSVNDQLESNAINAANNQFILSSVASNIQGCYSLNPTNPVQIGSSAAQRIHLDSQGNKIIFYYKNASDEPNLQPSAISKTNAKGATVAYLVTYCNNSSNSNNTSAPASAVPIITPTPGYQAQPDYLDGHYQVPQEKGLKQSLIKTLMGLFIPEAQAQAWASYLMTAASAVVLIGGMINPTGMIGDFLQTAGIVLTIVSVLMILLGIWAQYKSLTSAVTPEAMSKFMIKPIMRVVFGAINAGINTALAGITTRQMVIVQNRNDELKKILDQFTNASGGNQSVGIKTTSINLLQILFPPHIAYASEASLGTPFEIHQASDVHFCVNRYRQLDVACECKVQGNCFRFTEAMLPKDMRGLPGLKETLDPVHALFSGRTSYAELDPVKMRQNAEKMHDVAEAFHAAANKILKKKGIEAMPSFVSMIENYAPGLMKKIATKEVQEKYLSLQKNLSVGGIQRTFMAIQNNYKGLKGERKDAFDYGQASQRQKKSKLTKAMVHKNDTSSKNENGLLRNGEDDTGPIDHSKEQYDNLGIADNSQLSIWKMLSRRYQLKYPR